MASRPRISSAIAPARSNASVAVPKRKLPRVVGFLSRLRARLRRLSIQGRLDILGARSARRASSWAARSPTATRGRQFGDVGDRGNAASHRRCQGS